MQHEHIHIGKIAASFGVAGEIILVHSLQTKTALPKVTVLFVETTKDKLVPFFITKAKAKSTTEIIVSLEGVATKEAVKPLLQKQVWITNADFRRITPKNAAIGFIGFTVLENEKVLGPVEAVIEQPHQILLQINYQGHEALLPLHEETLIAINHAAKTIELTLPDGLLELYTG